MPVRNAERFLGNTIDSILAQTFKEFELIISDNDSMDSTVAIARDYAARDPRIHFIQNPDNRGAIANFNQVFSRGQGKYFKWAAHDDVLLPAYLGATIKLLEADPDVTWAHTLTRKTCFDSLVDLKHPFELAYDAPHSMLRDAEGPAHRRRDDPTSWKRIAAILLGTTWTSDIGGVFRSDALRETQLFLPIYGSEKTLLVEIAAQGKYAEVDEVLFLHREQPPTDRRVSVSAQTSWMDPNRRSRVQMPTHLRLALAHQQAISRSQMSFLGKAHGTRVICQYLCQFKKWPRAVARLTHEIRAQLPRLRQSKPNAVPDGGDSAATANSQLPLGKN